MSNTKLDLKNKSETFQLKSFRIDLVVFKKLIHIIEERLVIKEIVVNNRVVQPDNIDSLRVEFYDETSTNNFYIKAFMNFSTRIFKGGIGGTSYHPPETSGLMFELEAKLEIRLITQDVIGEIRISDKDNEVLQFTYNKVRELLAKFPKRISKIDLLPSIVLYAIPVILALYAAVISNVVDYLKNSTFIIVTVILWSFSTVYLIYETLTYKSYELLLNSSIKEYKEKLNINLKDWKIIIISLILGSLAFLIEKLFL